MTLKERILITVKTYPTISQSYGELVCTAGFKEDGSWIRLYPVPFRRMEDYKKFEKYQWMTARLRRRIDKDRRPESYSPILDSIELQEKISTGKNREWAGRKDVILKKGTVYDDLAAIIQLANANTLSLATFKPTEILDITTKAVDREWAPAKIAAVEAFRSQIDLFAGDDHFNEQFRTVKKLPYEFSYRFRDAKGKESHMMIEDWEVGALFWNCIKHGDSEEQAVQKVRDKYMGFWEKTDLHLFLGTTLQFHGRARNPLLIIGVFTPPPTNQEELGLWG